MYISNLQTYVLDSLLNVRKFGMCVRIRERTFEFSNVRLKFSDVRLNSRTYV